MTRLLNNQDLAHRLGWAVATIHQRRYRGASLPPSIRIGNTIRYRPEDVEQWIDSHLEDTTLPGNTDNASRVSN